MLEDNLRSPSGISYVVENRAALARVLPQLFAGERVRPVDQYGSMLLHALQRVGPPAAGDDRVELDMHELHLVPGEQVAEDHTPAVAGSATSGGTK